MAAGFISPKRRLPMNMRTAREMVFGIALCVVLLVLLVIHKPPAEGLGDIVVILSFLYLSVFVVVSSHLGACIESAIGDVTRCPTVVCPDGMTAAQIMLGLDSMLMCCDCRLWFDELKSISTKSITFFFCRAL